MEKNSFDYIAERLTLSLGEKGFEVNRHDNDFFCRNKDLEYNIKYMEDKRKIELKIRGISENDLPEDWRTLSSWMLDNESATNKDIDMICDDFIETICGCGAKKREIKHIVRKSGSDEKNVGSLFFANRMVNLFTDLKQEIYIEKECYSEFRGVKFARENIVSKINQLLKEGNDKKKIEKLGNLLSDLYDNGNLDVRGIITMVVLNSIEGENEISLLKQYMTKELISAWEASEKFKGKKIKPERPKKRRSFIADTLSSR